MIVTMSDTVAGEACGPVPVEAWDSGDRMGRELRDPFKASPPSLWEMVGDDLLAEVNAWCNAMRMRGGTLLQAMSTQAERKILVSALNDGLALIDHVDRQDGRSAAHTARALFEDLVNMRDVQTSTVNTPERYEDQKHVLADNVSKRRWHLPLLDGPSRKREEKRLERMGRGAAGPLAAALGKYKGFHLGWAEGSLRTRAEGLGLASAYEGYRILSRVVHGSSGALAGVTRQVGGATDFRIGMDLDLAATAYAEGLSSLASLFEGLAADLDGDAEDLHARTVGLLRGLPRVRDALAKVDAELWPVAPPPSRRITLLALYKSGQHRWYVYDPRDETVVVADPPAEEPDLSSFLALLETDDPSSRGGRPLTMMFEDVKVLPRAGAVAAPSAAILVPAGHPARFDNPRMFRPPAG